MSEPVWDEVSHHISALTSNCLEIKLRVFREPVIYQVAFVCMPIEMLPCWMDSNGSPHTDVLFQHSYDLSPEKYEILFDYCNEVEAYDLE